MRTLESAHRTAIRVAQQMENIASVDPQEATEIGLAYTRVFILHMAAISDSREDFLEGFKYLVDALFSDGLALIESKEAKSK